ncbi:AraC family transcriptional regulator [Flocculibacter collagenilyticus]|uniref:AraC family transcriptional regulator n=1 Tax=Flocculibacter collagenilyticus TaxID=2744479 RepID=UPI0018F4247F|nr:AraC family transcriptional regulator [Flocculibacter collagenilyticus]
MPALARSAVFVGFTELCAKYHINPIEIVLQAGLEPVVLRHNDLFISYTKFGQALNIAAQQSNNPLFGLMLSQYHDFLMLGPLGLLISQAETCEEILHIAQQYVHLHAQGVEIEVKLTNEHIYLCYQVKLAELNHCQQLVELGMGVILQAFNKLFSPTSKPNWIQFSCPPPTHKQDYLSHLDLPVHFSANCNAIVFDIALLKQSPIEQKAQLKQHFLSQLTPRTNDAQQNTTHSSMLHENIFLDETSSSNTLPLDYVRKILGDMLISSDMTLQTTASLVNIHPRTLQRRLQEHQLTFRQLLDEVRLMHAKQHLRFSKMRILDLALNLGYADATAFSRAFKRLTGSSPATWRKISADKK